MKKMSARGYRMLRAEGYIDKLGHSILIGCQLNSELIGFNSPHPQWTAFEVRDRPLAIALIDGRLYGIN